VSKPKPAKNTSEISTGADLKLEVVAIPVSDVDRSKRFYEALGWRLDADFVLGPEARVVQFTPPGSSCSIHFGTGITPAQPGSAQGLYLVVSDIEAARNSLIERGAKVTELLHRVSGALVPGAAAERQSYGSYATFNDPDGNGWLLQEVTVRLPGRIDSGAISYGSQSDLASALRRAADAHGAHEKETGQRDTDWAAWYAQYLIDEQTGAPTFRHS
jgi:predicted enzyme related to lactoylglutathione lyase